MSKTIAEAVRSILGAALVAGIAVVLSAGAARADTIIGPSLGSAITYPPWTVTGLGFTATVDSMLTSFTFQNQGLADTVDLVGPSGNILYSVATAAGLSSNTISVSWSLTASSQYYLLQTTASNGVFATFGLAAPSDAQIALTDTGDLSYASLVSANFAIGGGGGGGTAYWADFNNITTSPYTVPEPASFTLALPFAVAVFLRARRKGFDGRG